MSDVHTCPACGTKILFALDEKGTWQVLDVRRHPIFELVEEFQTERGGWRVRRIEAARVSHFVTCKDPRRFSGMHRQMIADAGHTTAGGE